MRIDRRTLNLIVPVTREDGATVYVHSAPIAEDMFDLYYKPIARTFNQIYSGGYGITAGPRIANRLLRDVSVDLGVWEDQKGVDGRPVPGVKSGLMNEIYRLTNVLAVGEKGWETVPYQEAVARGLLDAADASEVEGAIVFFTVASAMHRREQRAEVLAGAALLWSAQITSLNSTEYMNSLPTSTRAGSSGEKPA